MRWPFKIWERQYYLEPLLVFVLCIALLISLSERKKYKTLRWMPIYIVLLMVVYAWVSAGVSFFFAYALPYSLLENFINRNYYELFDQFYSIFYIFYIHLFLMIIRAYLCKPEKMI